MASNLTARKPLTANSRSHALNATKRKQKLNLQPYKLDNGQTVRLSRKEIRTSKKFKKEA